MIDHDMEVLGTVLFALAILHTFLVSYFQKLSRRFPKDSGREAFFHLLGEVEIVFGLWGGILCLFIALWKGPSIVVQYQESLHFTEPIFVFCILVMAATKPVMTAARHLISILGKALSRITGIPAVLSDLFVILSLGPLSGSFITEPAAMTVTALLLASMIRNPQSRLMYLILGTLFVNVSIGGALTPFAAPPILMVAQKWGWDFSFVFTHLGWKSALAVTLNAVLLIFWTRKEAQEGLRPLPASEEKIPKWVTISHFLMLAGVILSAHYPSVVMGLFLFFLGLTTVTKKYQEALRLRESLLVGFFLAGLILFGGFQSWWLAPFLSQMDQYVLYVGATALTAVTDNAALTYLGSQVPGLSPSSQYFLVAGAIAGGGLTIIANAPNAAGYSVLQKFFPNGLNPLYLLAGAAVPTIIAFIALGFLSPVQ